MEAEQQDVKKSLYPWVIWGVGALFFCFGFFLRVSPSVMVSELMRDFAIGAAALGNLTAFYFYAYGAAQLPVGMLLDRYGPRRVLSSAVLVCGAGCLLFGFADVIFQAYAGRLLIGLGCAFAFIGTLKIISLWFPIRRAALVTGLTAMVGMAGAVGGQAPLAMLVDFVGWRTSIIGGSFFAVALALMIIVFVRDRPPSMAVVARPSLRGTIVRDLGVVLRNDQTWCASAVIATVSVPLLAYAGLWGVPHMMSAYGLERPEAASATSMILIGWGMGAPIIGWLSDKTGKRKPALVFGSFFAFAALLCLIYVPGIPVWGAFALLFVNGFAGGATVVSYVVARVHNPPASAATASSVVNMAPVLLSAAFQALLGWLLDAQWDGALVDGARVYAESAYQMAFLPLIACAVIAMIGALRVREVR